MPAHLRGQPFGSAAWLPFRRLALLRGGPAFTTLEPSDFVMPNSFLVEVQAESWALRDFNFPIAKGLAHRRDFTSGQEPAGSPEVGLENIICIVNQTLPKSVEAAESFSTCD